jgi:hypothetical protein
VSLSPDTTERAQYERERALSAAAPAHTSPPPATH